MVEGADAGDITDPDQVARAKQPLPAGGDVQSADAVDEDEISEDDDYRKPHKEGEEGEEGEEEEEDPDGPRKHKKRHHPPGENPGPAAVEDVNGNGELGDQLVQA